jgi:hypothetical protein
MWFMVQEQPVRVERKLSAILAADVAGYSRLMHDDEEATHTRLTALLTGSVSPAITEHGGRVVKNTGDGFLAEFPSAVQAVRAAVQFQTRIKELTIADAKDRRVAFRVETASTLRHGLRVSQNPVVFASRLLSTITSEARSGLSSPIWGSRTSKTSHAPSEPMPPSGMQAQGHGAAAPHQARLQRHACPSWFYRSPTSAAAPSRNISWMGSLRA